MLSISDISKSYGDQTLFSAVTFNMGVRDRIAIIGPNGSGKTTLFNIIVGNVLPDSGSVNMPKETAIGYLEQEISPYSEKQLLDDVANASTRISKLAHKIQVLQEELAGGVDGESSKELLHELGELQHRFEFAGGYSAEHEAKIVLSGLGFADSDFLRPLTDFSGGWLMRAALAQFSDEHVNKPAIKELMKKCNIYVEPRLTKKRGIFSPAGIVEIKLKDGKKYSRRVDLAKGNPENPLSQEELIGKFKDCAMTRLPVGKVDCLLETIMHLEEIEDVTKLMDLTG